MHNIPDTPLRGVNFGGWLVLERWMTPRLFAETDARDEYQFMQTPNAAQKLQLHHKTFITEEDFHWLAAHNYNAIRIPIGYWILDGDGPYISCIEQLDWAIKMAAKYHLSVLISLHGAPGSQNGRDHSGRQGKAAWYGNPAYQIQTVDILSRLAKRYRTQKALWGIELLNEPIGWRHPLLLRRFYRQAYRQIQAVARPGLVTVFSDGFIPHIMSGSLTAQPRYPIAMDTHWYHFFMPRWMQRLTSFRFYEWRLRRRHALLARLSKRQPIIVGEWSGVVGSEGLSRYPKQKHEDIMRVHLRTQQSLFSDLAGWFYWSYKTEDRGIFHFRSMNEDGHTENPF